MRESAGPETETDDPSPPRTALRSARRRARAAWRKVASWVPREARSLVLLNLVTFIFGTIVQSLASPRLLGTDGSFMFAPHLFDVMVDKKMVHLFDGMVDKKMVRRVWDGGCFFCAEFP